MEDPDKKHPTMSLDHTHEDTLLTAEDGRLDLLIEMFLAYLNGQAPEPDARWLPEAEQETGRLVLRILDALAFSGPPSPPLHLDPVAIRLGLVPPPSEAENS